MKIAAALLAMIPALAHAGLFAELGIAKADGGTCIEDRKVESNTYGCSTSPLGSVELGYSWRGFSVSVEHISSLQEKDRGLNLFSAKYRWEWFK